MSASKLSKFLATFPTQLQFTKNEYAPNIWVFWSQIEPFKCNTSSGEYHFHETSLYMLVEIARKYNELYTNCHEHQKLPLLPFNVNFNGNV